VGAKDVVLRCASTHNHSSENLTQSGPRETSNKLGLAIEPEFFEGLASPDVASTIWRGSIFSMVKNVEIGHGRGQTARRLLFLIAGYEELATAGRDARKRMLGRPERADVINY